MIEAIFLVIGILLGAVVGWLVANTRRMAAEVRLEEATKQLEEQKRLLDDAKQQLGDAFKALSADALRSNNQTFLDLAKASFDTIIAEAEGDVAKRQVAIDGLIKPLQDALKRYEEQIKGMEENRQKAYGSLDEQLKTVASTQQQLQKETGNLVSALRTPQVRGRWGEITLDRVVEVAGLCEHCDFDRQPSVTTEDGRLRPDLVVRLPGGRSIVVDAKTPLDAYIDALEAVEDGPRCEAMRRHAAQVRTHIQNISSKAYWSQFASAPDFVVLFLPGESFFSAALEQDRELIEVGIRSKVLLATPTTLIALLRTVALSWHQEQIIENAEAIATASREFFERVSKFTEHLGRIHDGLERASKAFNEAVGSWQSRVLPSGRRVSELGGARQGADVVELEPVEVALRELPAASGGTTES